MMILIIMILTILQLIHFTINKNKIYNTFSCGIFGQVTNKPNKIDDSAIKILGLTNEVRGKDSCGITVDGEIYYGVNTEKLFSNFIKGRSFKAKKYPIVFGHTRMASVGIVNKYNAHPFGFGTNKEGDYKMAGVHNGTISNYKELAEKYKIKLTEKVPSLVNENMMIERDKIDSEVLLEILYKTKSFKVLSEYNGRAALVWTDTDHPNVVYLWSGKSASYEGFASTEEERPLNVWIESKNNFFLSSLKEGLHYIGAGEKEAFQIDYNTVYKITDGNFNAAEKFKVSRANNYISKSSYNSGYYGWGDDDWGVNLGKSSKGSVRNLPQTVTKPTSQVKEIINIFNDVTVKDQNDYKGKIYTKKLRYYRNGSLIKGIYIYIPHYGFYQLSEDIGYAKDKFKSLIGVKFVDGEFDFLNKQPDAIGEIPFKNKDMDPLFFYFIEGCMLKEKEDYIAISKLTDHFKKGNYYDYQALSHASMYPVIDIGKNYNFSEEQGIMHNGELFSGTINGMLFEKRYTVRGGNLVSVEIISEDDKKKSKLDLIKKHYEYDEKIYNQVTSYLKENEYNIKLVEAKQQSDDEFLDSLEKDLTDAEEIKQIVEGIINEEFAIPLDTFYNTKDKLEKYLPDPSAKEGIRIIDNIILSLKEYILK